MADGIAGDGVRTKRMQQRRTHVVAALWGFAEAMLFFVVPDVWISQVAVRSLRHGLWASGSALMGALAGGIVVYGMGQRHEATLLALYDRLPAISHASIARVASQLESLGGSGMVLGGFTGAPYKLYAAQAASAGMGLETFLAASALARGLRFVLVALLVGLIARMLTAKAGNRTARWILVVFWILFYAWYWSRMPN
jgi:membrane protein YqaA with SNARE-associated domain